MYGPIFHGVVIAIGLVSCFAGFRVFKLLITVIVMLAVGAGAGYLGFHYGSDPLVWSIGGAVVGAIVGGLLAYSFFSLAVGVAAALGIATSALPWLQQYPVAVQIVAIAASAAIAALLAVWLVNLTVQLATGLVGGILLVQGINFFITGEAIPQVEDAAIEGYYIHLDMNPTLAAIALGVGLLGFIVQRSSAKKADD